MNSSENIYDAVVIGAGPAGLSAAIYLSRARFSVLVLERENIGGQITITDEVVNYPGVLHTSGKALTETMRKQAENFGAEFLAAEARELDLSGNVKTIKTTRGEIRALGVVVAAGARPRSVGFKGEEEFRGRGVAYCATCDGEFFTGKELLVIGGGFAACEEAIFLTRYAKKITMLVRRNEFSCAQCVIEEVLSNPKISVRFNTELIEVRGNAAPESAILKNNKTGEVEEFRTDDGDSFGVFVFVGYAPASDLLKDKIAIDKDGYAVADEEGKTEIDGLYIAGDLRRKRLRQVVTAVADGATSATSLEKYLPEARKRAGVRTCDAGKIRKAVPVKQSEVPSENARKETASADGTFFDEAARIQLQTVFSRFENNIVLAAELDSGNPVSGELKNFLEEITSLSEKISLRIGAPENTDASSQQPCVTICDAAGNSRGVTFHGVPGGHEINSFIIALYNAAGPGQALDDETRERIRALRPQKIEVLVSLSCTQCPEVVTATQRIALENPEISTDVFDIAHFPEIRERYNVMSVPALAVNGKIVAFGKKSLPQILEILEK
ncbi:MAG: FAD-dependent oxidoreductase [Opitutales bacterium]|nr:FAD-dependent oxidoreductase [Opitutales bacterium]